MNDRILEAIKKLKEKYTDLEVDFKVLKKDIEEKSNFNMQKALIAVADDLGKYIIKDGYWWYNGKNTGIKAEGIDGKEGPQGVPGKDGAPGRDGLDGLPGRDGKDGAPGKNGKDGAPGRDGKDGKDGRDGKDGKDGVIPSLKIGKVEQSDQYGGAKADIRKGKNGVLYLDLTLPRGPQGFMGFDAKINGVNTLTIEAGDNIQLDQKDDVLTISSTGGSGGTSDYSELINKPSINGVELNGNKTSNDLGVQTEITNDNKLSSDLVDDTDHTNKFVTSAEKTTWSGKQDALVSGTNIKTINNISILGSGNIDASSNVAVYPNSGIDVADLLTNDSVNVNSYFQNALIENCELDSNYQIVKMNPFVMGVKQGLIVVPIYFYPSTKSQYRTGAFQAIHEISGGHLYIKVNVQFENGTGRLIDYRAFGKVLLTPTSNIQYTPQYDYNPANKKYVDDNIQTIQYSTMPTASADNLGQIVQYIGTTTSDYINGYFYICVENNSSYAWQNLSVQAGGGATGDTVHYVPGVYGSGNPFVLEGKDVGIYVFNSNDNQAVYIKGKSEFSARRALADYVYVLYIIKKYEDASEGERIAYTCFSPLMKSSGTPAYTYTTQMQLVQKIMANPGVVVTDTRKKTYSLVSINEAETITGLKTFSVLPQSSVTPSNNNDLVNKSYVDSAISSAITDALGGNY